VYRIVSQIARAFRGQGTRLRHATWRRRLKFMGRNVNISKTAVIRSPRTVTIGDGTALGDFVHIWGGGGVSIGANTLLAAHTVISSQGHEVEALSKGLLYRETETRAPVRIGNNVWIASQVVIGAGVVIGDGSIIGAGSIVLRDVPAGTLVAGNPAREIRRLNVSHEA